MYVYVCVYICVCVNGWVGLSVFVCLREVCVCQCPINVILMTCYNHITSQRVDFILLRHNHSVPNLLLCRTLSLLVAYIGVPVIGYDTKIFPAFFTNDSGIPSPMIISEPGIIAEMLLSQLKLGLNNG